MDKKQIYSVKWRQPYSFTTTTNLMQILTKKLEDDQEQDLNNSGFEEANLVIDRIKNLK